MDTEEVKVEETQPVEETTPKTDGEPEEATPQPLQEKVSELESLNKQLFARVKKAEEKAKELEKKTEKVFEKESKEYDPEDVAVDMLTLRDLDEESQKKLIKDSKAYNKTIQEMRKDQDFSLWLEAHNKKVERENTLPPSTKQSPGGKKRLTDLNPEERREYLKSLGAIRI